MRDRPGVQPGAGSFGKNLNVTLSRMAYHPGTAEVTGDMASIRRIIMKTTTDLWSLIPEGDEKTLAMRGLQDALIHALAALAMLTPADLVTPEVARVYPGTDTPHPPTGELKYDLGGELTAP